jgi:LacI family transcriptional regulator
MTSEIDQSLPDSLAKRKVPLVFLDVGQIAQGVSNVKVDYACGVAQVVEHLLALGHGRFAFISGPLRLKSVLERRDAFLDCLEAPHGGRRCKLLVEEGNHKVDGGFEAMQRVLERAPATTAVIASNDLTAIGAMRAIRQRGLRVPEDISVVGFDDIQMAQFTEPPLTTVKLIRTEVARLACEALLHSIETRGTGVEFCMSTALVVRASTGPVRLE